MGFSRFRRSRHPCNIGNFLRRRSKPVNVTYPQITHYEAPAAVSPKLSSPPDARAAPKRLNQRDPDSLRVRFGRFSPPSHTRSAGAHSSGSPRCIRTRPGSTIHREPATARVSSTAKKPLRRSRMAGILPRGPSSRTAACALLRRKSRHLAEIVIQGNERPALAGARREYPLVRRASKALVTDRHDVVTGGL